MQIGRTACARWDKSAHKNWPLGPNQISPDQADALSFIQDFPVIAGHDPFHELVE